MIGVDSPPGTREWRLMVISQPLRGMGFPVPWSAEGQGYCLGTPGQAQSLGQGCGPFLELLVDEPGKSDLYKPFFLLLRF